MWGTRPRGTGAALRCGPHTSLRIRKRAELKSPAILASNSPFLGQESVKPKLLLLSGFALLSGIGVLGFWRIETNHLENCGIPLGKHEYRLGPTTTEKTVGSSVLQIDSVEQRDSIFHPTFKISRSIRPADVLTCGNADSVFKRSGALVLNASGSGELIDPLSQCVWQADIPAFENNLRQLDDELARIHYLPIPDKDALIIRAAEAGNTTGLFDYLQLQVLNNFAPAEYRYALGTIPTDPDRAVTYWKVLKARSPHLSPNELKRLEKTTSGLGGWFYHEGEQLTSWDSDENFPLSMKWFARAAAVGEADGMLAYLRGCLMQALLNATPGGVVRYAPNYKPDKTLATQYFNSVLNLEHAGSLHSTWQKKTLQMVKGGWGSYLESEGQSISTPKTDPAEPPRAATDDNQRIQIYSDYRLDVDSITTKPYYSGAILEATIFNKSDSMLETIVIDVNCYDSGGVQTDSPAFVFHDVMPHSTATKEMNGSLLRQPARTQVVRVSYPR